MMRATNVEKYFQEVRTRAGQGNPVVVRGDGRYLLMPKLDKASVDPKMIVGVEQIIPSTSRRNVAVIGDTSWASETFPSVQAANQAIPFFGILRGFACIGHCVWVFNGAANLLNAGCRSADLLIIDSESVANLPSTWQASAQKATRSAQIVVHDRATYQLRRPS